MATEAEIEAAAEKLHVHLIGGRTLDDCRVLARAALAAAERVRAEALPAKQDDAERARRSRARKRDGRDAGNVPGASRRKMLARVSAMRTRTRASTSPAVNTGTSNPSPR